jgi:hypothetical protein
MKKYNTILTITAIATATLMLFTSCNNSSHDAQAVIDKYCELNTKEHTSSTGAEKEAAAAEKKAYEKEVDDKYFKDNKTYQLIMDGMKKCDEAFTGEAQAAPTSESNFDTGVPSAYGDVVSVANNYCSLVDKSIAAAQNGNDAELKNIMAVRVIFENNMDESYKDNPARRDSIFQLIEPCMKKEVIARHQ